jgi:hypothetical protein
MRILIPYIGVELPSIRMSEYGVREGFTVDIEHIGRPRLRKAAPGVVGIPHQEYKVRLYPISDEYRKWSAHSGRRTNSICWHGHKNFMCRLFYDFDSTTIRSALIEYNGQKDFFNKYASTRDLFFANGKCNCTGLKLAVFERELV